MRRRANPNQLSLFDAPASMPTSLSRATASRSRKWETPSPRPWLCVVLAIDTAKRSGWALYCLGKLQEHGEVDTLDEPTLDQIVSNALDYAQRAPTKENPSIPCALVLEAPFGGAVEVVAQLGVARERWLRAWRAADQSPRRVVRVQPSTWRGPVLGAEWVGAPRAEVRAHELRSAGALIGKRMLLGHDEAAAILIGRWAAHAAAVGRVIGKRATKASLREWTRRI